MKDFLNKLKYSLARFMYGRYGVDQLSTFLVIAALAITLAFRIFSFPGMTFAAMLADALLIFSIYRTYSKNLDKRRAELAKYYKIVGPIKNRFSAFFKGLKDKDHKYFVCKKCSSILRVPKGKGEIVITCPKCGEKTKTKS